MVRYPTTNAELKTIVRGETSYEDTEDELPDSQLDVIVDRAKATVELKTGSNNWYSDDGLGHALAAYTAMRAKSAVENVGLDSYSLGDTDVSFSDTDPDSSQQLQQWADDVALGLNASDVDTSGSSLQMENTSGYVGESYYEQQQSASE